MKTSLYIFFLLVLVTIQLHAQNPYTQSEILGLTYFNYKAVDFGITKTKNLVEINEKTYVLNFDSSELKLNTTKKYKIKKDKITYRYYKGKYYTSESDYLYDKKYKTIQKRVYRTSKGEKIDFSIDKKGRIIQLTTSFEKTGNNTYKYWVYNDTNNSIERYVKYDTGVKKVLETLKTNKNGLIISKDKSTTNYGADKINYTYSYTDNNISSITKKEFYDNVLIKNSTETSDYLYNNKDLIIEDKGNLTNSDLKFKHHDIYEYEYDKNGNWIVKYQFKTIYGYDDLYTQNYKGIKMITLRKLTYKKETTGTTDIKSNRVQNYLNEVVANNPFKTKKAPIDGVYWVRSNDKAVRIYEDGKYIGAQSNLLIILKNDFYINDSINNKMYVLKDFKLKPQNKAFYKATNFASSDEVVWFRSNEKAIKSYKNGISLTNKLNFFKIYGNQFFINDSTTNTFYKLKDFGKKTIEGSFYKALKIGEQNEVLYIKLENGNYTIVQNGKNITNQTKMVYAKNKNDILIKINGTPKYVMVNAVNKTTNDFFKTITYSQYIVENPNEAKKEVIPNGFLWKKNKGEQFYIYKDNKVDLSKIKVVGFYQHQFVYDIDDNYSYLLEDFNNKEIEKYYPIKMLNGNAFFYKTSENKLGIFIDGIAVDFTGSKYAENGIDVIAKSKDGILTYILKNYKNVANLTLSEVIIE